MCKVNGILRVVKGLYIECVAIYAAAFPSLFSFSRARPGAYPESERYQMQINSKITGLKCANTKANYSGSLLCY